jgi:hypothetical protein
MRYIIACIIFLLFSATLNAQEQLNNETILKLVKAGIGEDTIVGMVNQQPGKYSLSTDDIIAFKAAGVSDKVIAAIIVRAGALALPQPMTNGTLHVAVSSQPASQSPLVLHDGTPIRLRLNRTLTSADAKAGDNVDFEVLDDIKVDDAMLIPRSSMAIATITEAEHKKRMARGGKLDVNIDYVRLVNGEKVALRAVKEVKGGGHTGAMTGAMVATAIVVWPAAPFFLFMHGKDVTIPKGTEITAYVNGEIKLDRTRFVGSAPAQMLVASSPQPMPVMSPATFTSTVAPAPSNPIVGGLVDITFTSTPANALVSIGGMAIGRTPFTTKIPLGYYKATFSVYGFVNSIESLSVGAGYPTTVNAILNANSTQ